MLHLEVNLVEKAVALNWWIWRQAKLMSVLSVSSPNVTCWAESAWCGLDAHLAICKIISRLCKVIKLLRAHFLFSCLPVVIISWCNVIVPTYSSSWRSLRLLEVTRGDQTGTLYYYIISDRNIILPTACHVPPWQGCPRASKVWFLLSQCDVNACCAPG